MMRDLIFDIIADIGETLISSLQYIFNLLIVIQTNVYTYIIKVIANVFKLILYIVYSDKVEHAEQVILQMPLNKELDILMNITKVKEDALSQKIWRQEHSMALNNLGSRLHYECNWEKSKIHDYMRALVESIPGLTYLEGNEDDDDDDYDDDDTVLEV